MTPSQLIHLARVAGYKITSNEFLIHHTFKMSDKNPSWLRLHRYNPHTPEGAAQFRELWMALDKKTQGNVVVKYFHKNGLNLSVASARDFTTWLFAHPEEACQIIYEVTGGEKK